MTATSAMVTVEATDFARAPVAAEWVRAFYPAIQVRLEGEEAMLSSEAHDSDQLRLVWRSALLNERLRQAASGGRGEVLETLLR